MKNNIVEDLDKLLETGLSSRIITTSDLSQFYYLVDSGEIHKVTYQDKRVTQLSNGYNYVNKTGKGREHDGYVVLPVKTQTHFIEISPDNLSEGDKVETTNGEIMILGIHGKVYLLSEPHNHDRYGQSATFTQLQEMESKIKSEKFIAIIWPDLISEITGINPNNFEVPPHFD